MEIATETQRREIRNRLCPSDLLQQVTCYFLFNWVHLTWVPNPLAPLSMWQTGRPSELSHNSHFSGYDNLKLIPEIEGESRNSLPSTNVHAKESFLIQVIFRLLRIAEAQITAVVFGLRGVHKCQILLLPTDQIKAQKPLRPIDQVQTLNGGPCLATQRIHLPTPHPQAQRTDLARPPGFVCHGPQRRCDVSGRQGVEQMLIARCAGPAVFHPLETYVPCMLAGKL